MRKYFLYILIGLVALSSVVSVAEVIVGSTPVSDLDNVTIGYSLSAAVNPKQVLNYGASVQGVAATNIRNGLAFSASYNCDITLNQSGTIKTIACFEAPETTTTTTTTTSTATTAANVVFPAPAPAPATTITPPEPVVSEDKGKLIALAVAAFLLLILLATAARRR